MTLHATAAKINRLIQNMTAEQAFTYYRGLYADVTPQEAQELYIAFKAALDSTKTKAERARAFTHYRQLLKPVEDRQGGISSASNAD